MHIIDGRLLAIQGDLGKDCNGKIIVRSRRGELWYYSRMTTGWLFDAISNERASKEDPLIRFSRGRQVDTIVGLRNGTQLHRAKC